MCIQTYSSYVLCPCQIRKEFKACEFGPASPHCLGRRDIICKTDHPYCDYHARINKHDDTARNDFFHTRGRRMLPVPPDVPVLGRKIGGRALQTAGAANRGRFPHVATTPRSRSSD
ncbi:hypothetical protein F5Y04DRAFT_284743 [Hypomontagnella monticulosa]|nr:hypothetical protein F5Y04DRAFT_284743 [Hypomontagnella monticulosa]